MKYLFVPLLFPLLFACKTVQNDTDKSWIHVADNQSWIHKADQIIFIYDDASVPPDDHRSYTITVSPDQLFFEVDSYGNIIREDSVSITKNKWNQIRQAFVDSQIHNIAEKENPEGCTGGSGNQVYVSMGLKSLFSGNQYRCGGFNEGNLSGDLDGFEKAIRQDLPSSLFRLD